MLSVDAKDTEAFLWCLDKAILFVTHCNNSPENLNGTLALTNTKPCLIDSNAGCALQTIWNAMQIIFQCKPCEKCPSEGSEVEKYWQHWVWKYCMSCSHSKSVAGKPCWWPSWNGAYVTRHSPSSLCKHQPASQNIWNADFLCLKTV